jgi:uncharacterized protein
MADELNGTGNAHARSLIGAGKVDKTSSWSMSADDENAILGTDNWTTYSSWHFGIDRGEADKTKARYKYPFGKSGKVYRSALTAIRQRAGQQSATAIFNAAGSLLEMIDGKAKSAEPELEFKGARFEYRFTETDAPTTKWCFEGYASVFNKEDDFGDVMLPGAFKQTLLDHEAAGTMPKMLLNHGGMGSFFASPAPEDLLPIGKWTSMHEDSKGLPSKGRLINLDTESGKRIYGAMKENALDGLSIGFKAQDFIRGTKESEPRRSLKQVKLIEVSPVTFPANGAATVSSVRSASDFPDLKTAERLLRDAAGFSKSEATAFISRVLSFRSDSATDGETKQAIEALNRRRVILFGR